MRPIRIIPKLEIKGPNLVKGIHLEGLRVLGRPEDFAYQYYLDGADELIYIDIVASLYERNNLLDIVRRTAERVFIPLTVGGGIRTTDDIRNILRAGADKVAINTAAIQNPDLIKEGAEIFGSQCIVVSIEARKKTNGIYEAFIDNGRQETGVDVFKWARQAYKLGAGEILITSIDRDGTGEGYDLELISKISEIVPIPIIACGGAGKLKDIEELIKYSQVNAISAASVFHYAQITKELAIEKFEEGNIEFLKKYSTAGAYLFRRIQPLSVHDLKVSLKKPSTVCMRPAWPEKNNFTRSQDDSPSIVVVDFGCGNLFSIANALEKIKANFTISSDPEIIKQSDKLILPGVGSFGEGMSELRRRNLIEPIRTHAKKGKPILGICLGAQLLMSKSEEFGQYEGLNLIEGEVIKIRIPSEDVSIFKVPHIGWNQIKLPQEESFGNENIDLWEGTILKDIPPGSLMYFVHSYIIALRDARYKLADTEYGKNLFPSVIKKDNIYGCQFHPEKSGEIGLNLFNGFVFKQEPVKN